MREITAHGRVEILKLALVGGEEPVSDINRFIFED
jgi:hypothetical protein